MSGARLLVVDDDRGLLRLAEKLLRRAGYEVSASASGAEALAQLEKETPQLMLVDLDLPDIPGREIIRRTRERGTPAPFIVITGHGDERTAVEMMKQGAIDYIVKDANFLEFLPGVVERTLQQLENQRKLATAEEALKKETELNASLLEQLLKVSEREQRRIGDDLHDGLGQVLAGIEMMSQALELRLEKNKAKEAASAGEIARLVREAISQTKDLSRGLSPVALEAEGLMAALQAMAASAEHRFRIRCEFICPKPILVADNAVATHLFRIAQEGVSNAVKHGKAKRVWITLERAGTTTILTVRDNGIGLAAAPKTGGMGMHIMQYRARMIGATVAVENQPEGGAVVRCTHN